MKSDQTIKAENLKRALKRILEYTFLIKKRMEKGDKKYTEDDYMNILRLQLRSIYDYKKGETANLYIDILLKKEFLQKAEDSFFLELTEEGSKFITDVSSKEPKEKTKWKRIGIFFATKLDVIITAAIVSAITAIITVVISRFV